MSTTYDWSPVFGAIQGLGQRLQYQKALAAMFPQQQPQAVPQPTGPLSGDSMGAPPSPQLPQQAPQANPYGSVLPMLKFMDPSIGMPLLMQMQMRKAEHDQEMQDKALTPMTPDEVKAAGFRPGTVAYKDIHGQPHVLQESDLKSPEAVQQALDVKKQEGVINSQAPISAKDQAEIDLRKRMLGIQAGELAEKQREFNMQNPMLMGGGQGGARSLSDYPQATQAMVKAMLEGRQAPPTSFALSKPYWQNMIALANSVDPTFDQTQWGARVSARKDMLGGGTSYKTLNSGNTAIQHLGRLHDQIGDVAGHQIPLVGNLINAGENAVAGASGQPGLNAYADTLGHLAEETTKFYRGTGGSEADVTRNMSNLSPNLSTAQKQSGVANTVHLIYGKLQPMVEQYNKTMGTSYPTSHFLSQEAVKTMKKMGYDPDSGESIAQAGGSGWSIKVKQ